MGRVTLCFKAILFQEFEGDLLIATKVGFFINQINLTVRQINICEIQIFAADNFFKHDQA